ncbi:MAG: DUF6496 domain-containing protein [Gammaproteobacteria bacterium]
MAKYGKKAQAKVREVMEEFAAGELRSGRSGKKVTNRRQAVAIGLAEAREAGAKVPPPPAPRAGRKKSATKTSGKKKAAKSRASKKKAPSKKTPGRKTQKRAS